MEQQIMYAFDLIGTVIFAVTGAVRGVHLKLDLLGVIVFACTVGVGGGMMRDTIIGATPVAALKNETYLLACLLTGLIVFFSARWVTSKRRLIIWLDAVGLGVFTALGAAKGDAYHLTCIGIVLTGVFTAAGGGVIRDLMSVRIPLIFVSDFYATASLLGGFLYFMLARWTSVPLFWNFILVLVFVAGLRMAAVHYKLQLPSAGRFRRKKR